MDLAELNETAKRNAIRHVSSILQQSDQLEKIEHHKKKAARKKASVEAMLKTAVQSQLEGVKLGLSQLHTALEEMNAVKESLNDLDEKYANVATSSARLKELREASNLHSQYAAAKENLAQIFQVPETIEKTKSLILDGKLLHAHKNLLELENARDNLLLELHRLQRDNPNSQEARSLQSYFSGVDQVANELGKQMWFRVGQFLNTLRNDPAKIVDVLRIVHREERLDEHLVEKQKSSGFIPPHRPRRWRKKLFEVLDNMVKHRIEGNEVEDRSMNKHWLVLYLERCRQIVVQDLKCMRTAGEPCFPPEWCIFDRFVDMYHRHISGRLNDLSNDMDLNKTELVQLLGWVVKTYRSQEMLGSPGLAIDVDKLSPLLKPEVVDGLVRKFIDIITKDVEDWLERTLTKEKDDWFADKRPEPDSMGYLYSALPSILFEMIDGQLVLAHEVGDASIARVLTMCIESMINFAEKYQRSFVAYATKHFEDRSTFRHYTQVMVSIANTAQICVESCDKLRQQGKTATDDVTMRQQLVHKVDNLKDKWFQNAQKALDCLLDEIRTDLQPHLAEILTKKWLNGSNSVETISATVDDYYNDHSHLKPILLKSFIEKIQLIVMCEYIRAVESNRLKLNNQEERTKAAHQLQWESTHLAASFSRMKKIKDDQIDLITGVLAGISKIIDLSDRSLLPLETSSFVQKYPELQVNQLAGILCMRGDVSKSEARELATELLHQNRHRLSVTATLYSQLFLRTPPAKEI